MALWQLFQESCPVIGLQGIQKFRRFLLRQCLNDLFLLFVLQKLEGLRRMIWIECLEQLPRPFGIAVGKFRDTLRRYFVQLDKLRDLIVLEQVFDVIHFEHSSNVSNRVLSARKSTSY